MRTKEEHREYMRQWRKRRDPQNSPELPKIAIRLPFNSITRTKPYQNLNQNCDTISPTKRFVDIWLLHPNRKTKWHFTECSGRTLIALKKQDFELIEKI